ncbi:MAG TPA: hypothetical protein VNC78_09505 [Actinomycetota bacterium]|nr:hypothetical protein [Actinomycetota bacterium]
MEMDVAPSSKGTPDPALGGAMSQDDVRIVIVCTGNLCRSPMGEAMLRGALAAKECERVRVSSSGTWAMFGNPATSDAIATVKARGMELDAHRSRPVDIKELIEADLVLAMTSVHLREIEELAPEAAGKVRLVKELREIKVGVVEGSPKERIQALLRAPRPPRRRSLDLDDPMGLPASAYERAAAELEAGLEVLASLICD